MIPVVLDSAVLDLEDGRDFYDRQQIGIGEYFVASILADIEGMPPVAGAHRVHHGFRRMFADRFPFALYYLIEENEIRIYAILDMRSNPAWIRSELAKRSG